MKCIINCNSKAINLINFTLTYRAKNTPKNLTIRDGNS